MIEMKSTSRELTKVERYRLTLSPEIKTIQDLADDSVISVSAFCTFNDVNEETGEVAQLLGILDKDGKTAYVTQSKTFKESFMNIADIFAEDNEEFAIRKISGTSKSGRGYVDCVLA